MRKTGRILMGLCAVWTLTLLATAQPMPKTTKESIAGTPTVKTETVKGTVMAVEGNHLVVRMAAGDYRSFDVPESRRFVVDGKELTVGELKPGTKLTATVTTTTTPITERTKTVGTGRVFFQSGNTVILTLPNNENRQYKVDDNYRFTVDGQPASVHDLRKGMVISAQKIVEEPKTEIASNTTVVGEAPPPPRPTRTAETPPPPTPPAAPVTAAPPEPKPAPPPVHAAPPKAAEPREETPAELPKTSSEMPLIGLVGVLLLATSLALNRIRRV